MYLEIQQRIQERFREVVFELYGREIDLPVLDTPPSLRMGDISVTACFELAKHLRQAPRRIAEQISARVLPVDGVERVTVAGAGYLNFHLERAALAESTYHLRTAPAEPAASGQGKILVEHTSINPNKAAHIGHLRNAVLGDTFARLLRFRGNAVEVQNYIDNTGVQVADVVVGFIHLEKKKLGEVEDLIRHPRMRFDYYCWDLYARVFKFYEENEDARLLRAETLKAIEEGQGEPAAMAELISTAIVRSHLATMLRINVRYDLLARESEILRLEFWKHAFELMKKTGAIRYEQAGKNAGCWVMSLNGDDDGQTEEEAGSEDVKIIVRSNGTVTYVGKDIAYHLWKFGLLGKDFGYRMFHRYPDDCLVWCTSLESDPGAPGFGNASYAYSVIDTRQSYLQNIVAAAFRALGYEEQAKRLHHFAYEVVGLTPRCAREMGYELSEEELKRSYVEVSGRKGLGIKADDLIDRLIVEAREEVRSRDIEQDPAEQENSARLIAVGALRYFLSKFSRRMIIAFDFKEALAFEGETGPYLQYSVVRARNIFRKFQEVRPGVTPDLLGALVSREELRQFLSGENGLAFWELVLLSAQLEMMTDQAISAQEPAIIAKYAFRLAQNFNNFYHSFHILSEQDPARQNFLLYLVHMVKDTLTRALDLLGIEVPARM
ncbi:MAG TPA: arginine--tRNA ligase [Terriglobia bacterium]|nr:arginine--tRNA ligase [Terriglobia bacterium]